MKSFLYCEFNDNNQLSKLGGSCKAKDLRGQIREVEDLLRRES